MGLISSLTKLLIVVAAIVVLGFVIKASLKGSFVKGIDDISKGIIEGIDALDDVFSDSSARDELIQNKNKYLKQSMSILEVLNKKLDKILSQLTEMDNKVGEMQLELKFNNFYHSLTGLKASIENFHITVKSYSFNETILGIQVKKYVDNYIKENYEAKIIAFLEISVPTSKAPIDVLIKVIKEKSNSKFFEVQSSSNKMIFDFYADLIVLLNSAGTLITSYYELLSKLKNENIGDIDMLNRTMEANNKKLFKSFDCAMKKVNETTDLVSFMDLQTAEYVTDYSVISKCYVGKIEAANGFVVTGVRFRVEKKTLFLQIQTGKSIHLGIVNQTTVEWQDIPTESQIKSKDIYDLPNRLEQLDTHNSCTFMNKMVTGIQLQQQVSQSTTKFHLNIFSNDDKKGCDTYFVMIRNLEEVKNGRDEFKLPKEANAGSTYDGNNIVFVESAPISGVGFYTYLRDNVNHHRPYIFSLNYGLLLEKEGFADKLGKSLQSEPGFYTKHSDL
ncbi:unnamed protein product [Diamesa tonsa]